MLWNFIFSTLSFKITAKHSDGQFRCNWLSAAIAGMTVASLTTIFAYIGLRVMGGTPGGLLYVCSPFLAAIIPLLCTLFKLPWFYVRSPQALVRCIPIYWVCMFMTALFQVLLNVWPLILVGGASGVGLGYSRFLGF